MFELDKNNFETEILASEEPVWSTSVTATVVCPVKPEARLILKLEETYGDRLRFTALNTSGARRLAIQQRIFGPPGRRHLPGQRESRRTD